MSKLLEALARIKFFPPGTTVTVTREEKQEIDKLMVLFPESTDNSQFWPVVVEGDDKAPE